jgi:hypothetical protein
MASQLDRDMPDAASADELDNEGFVTNSLEFSAAHVPNPLRFVQAWAKDKTAKIQRSAWLLTMLAFERPAKSEET